MNERERQRERETEMRSLEMRKARERIVLYEVFFFGILRMSVCVSVCVLVCVC